MTKVEKDWWLSLAKYWFNRHMEGRAHAEIAMWRCLLRWASGEVYLEPWDPWL